MWATVDGAPTFERDRQGEELIARKGPEHLPGVVVQTHRVVLQEVKVQEPCGLRGAEGRGAKTRPSPGRCRSE
jgi:hypothetical protein